MQLSTVLRQHKLKNQGEGSTQLPKCLTPYLPQGLERTVTVTLITRNRQQTREYQLGLGWKLREPELPAIYMWAGWCSGCLSPSSTLSLVPTSMHTTTPRLTPRSASHSLCSPKELEDFRPWYPLCHHHSTVLRTQRSARRGRGIADRRAQSR